jgi:hypothetical protein
LGIAVPPKDEDGVENNDDDDDDENIRTPIRPSAKALGKRRVIEADETDRKFLRLFLSIKGIHH